MLNWEMLGTKVMGLLLLGVAVGHALFALRTWLMREPTIAAHFSPKGGCTEAIVAEVNAARSEILVMAYSFSCPDIANSLIAALGRGVKVIVLLDRSNEAETYSELGDLERHGMEVWIDACHAIAHNKIIVIDKRIIITGSFNFTRQAEHSNAENLLILKYHHELASRYRDNFHAHKEHCQAPGAKKTEPTAHANHSRRAA
jgi:phosphatidylserine/phosphatidylglycerophosphate/cardiolipin synthase-like enzyme